MSGVDLQWNLLTDASRNLGNAITGAAQTISGRTTQRRDREATANYLANPNDPEAFTSLAERNPAMAYQLRDEQVQRARQLRGDQREQLTFAARILRNVRDEAGFQQARQIARQAGIPLDGVPESYDPAWVGQIQELDRVLNPVDPVTVAEGGRLVNPQTGAVIAEGAPRRPRYYSVPPGGRLVADPSAVPPDNAQIDPNLNTGELIAVNPQTGERLRLNPQTNQWEPVQGGASRPGSQTFPQGEW